MKATVFSSEPTIEQIIGRKLLISLPGVSLSDSTLILAKQWIDKEQIGGIIFFEYNIESKNQIQSLIRNLKKDAPFLPIFAVDEEGGYVKRLKKKKGFLSLPSAKWIAQNKNVEDSQKIYFKHSQELQSLGFNVNLAPVVDLDINPKSPAIGKANRSFSKDPKTVIKFAKTMIDAMEASEIIPTLKHFPGHGSAENDSHLGLTNISGTWTQKELAPFEYFIKNETPIIILIGHLYHDQIDSLYPATMSAKTIQGLLRNKLGFHGVVLSDDLQMGALTAQYSIEDIVIESIRAGNDLLQFSDPLKIDENFPQWFYTTVAKAMDEGIIDKHELENWQIDR